MNILLFDTPGRTKFYPLTLTRAIADLRFGILTIKERWERLLKLKGFILTQDYLQAKYEEIISGEYLVIDPTVLTSRELASQVKLLEVGKGLFDEDGLVAARLNFDSTPLFSTDFPSLIEEKISVEGIRRLETPFNLFQFNDEMLRFDFTLVSKNRISNNNHLETSQIVKASQIFIEEGAKVDFSVLNASTGPIYIGRNATVMEGCLIRGPFALCEGATLKMASQVYGATTIGPYSVGGGEIKNSILIGYSNKAHAGYLGDSVIGEWCNIGAGTSNSNVKNNASEVKVWSFYENCYLPSGTKCGLVMGDYSRTAINTSVNTGTVVGVCCNVFGEGLTPKLIPNFTWSTKEQTTYEFDKALKDIENWQKMKNKELSQEDRLILKYIFENFND